MYLRSVINCLAEEPIQAETVEIRVCFSLRFDWYFIEGYEITPRLKETFHIRA